MPLVHAVDIAAARTALETAPSPVVVIPVYNGYEDVVRCYRSVFEHSPTELAVLVVDDRGADRRPIDELESIVDNDRAVVVLHRAENGGFTRACNDAFEATGRRDVILVNSDVVVGPGWASRLVEAAASSTLVATVSTLTNHGTILSLPERNTPSGRLPDGLDPAQAARRVAETSLLLRPTIPTAIGHCVYIRRIALDLVGGFDVSFGTGYGEEVDFCQRCVRVGLKHVCADDVFTFHRGGVSFGAGATEQQRRNEGIVSERYPWYQPWVGRASRDQHAPLARALDQARVALVGARIGVDATSLGGFWAGTQTVVLETIRALAPQVRAPDRLVVFHTSALSDPAREVLVALDGVRLVDVATIPDSGSDREVVDVIYRPCQVNTLDELRWLRRRGRRVIVNQLDIIAWSNPSYFSSDRLWLAYRELTRIVLGSVDGVAFISDVARREVAAEGMLPDETPSHVVYCGTTSAFEQPDSPRRRPAGIRAADEPYLFLIGASYHHKNRVFACRLLQRLRARGWDGRLVLAGPTPPDGNSLEDEREVITADGLDDVVEVLADVSEEEKNWLYAHAALTVYPTTSEGFGLVPFESARWDVPVMSSRQGSLDEVLPHDLPTLAGYDLEAATDLAWTLLHAGDVRDATCEALRDRAGAFTWDRTAAGVLALIGEVLRRPTNRVVAQWGEAGAHGWPEGWGRAAPALLDRALRRMLRAERIKRAVVPEGSSRQRYARQSINWLRERAR